jgi:hypothetical protein
VELAAFLGGLNRIFQRQARRPRRPLQILKGEQGSRIRARLKMSDVRLRKLESSSSQKMEVVPGSDCAERDPNSVVVNIVDFEKFHCDVSGPQSNLSSPRGRPCCSLLPRDIGSMLVHTHDECIDHLHRAVVGGGH